MGRLTSSRTSLLATPLLLLLVAVSPAVVAQDADPSPGDRAPDATTSAEADVEAQILAVDPNPLEPTDTSSPRDTFVSYDTHFRRAVEAWQAGASRQVRRRAIKRAWDAFDFSELPPRGRDARMIKTVLWLQEILARLDPIDFREIPGDEEVAAQGLTSWTIPGTGITIARQEEGPNAGAFLFTAQTVASLEDLHERAEDLPYKSPEFAGIFAKFAYTPGIPFERWAPLLPAWSNRVVLGQAIWQWIAFAAIVVVTFLVTRWLLRLGGRWDHRGNGFGAIARFGLPISVAAAVLLILCARWVLLVPVRFGGTYWSVVSTIGWSLVFAGCAWLIFLVPSRVANVINRARQVKQGSIDGQLVRVILRLASLFILAFLVIYAAEFFGVPLTPVVAGIGVGGLAIALAVRPTLENVIGGLTLFADKPVRIGDFCRFGQEYATVEQIGLRSIRLRKLDDTLVTVPNADFSQRELTNFAERRLRLYRTTVRLRYETTPEQLRYVIDRFREMLLGHPKVSPDRLHVRLDAFGTYAFDVELFAYVRETDWLEYRAVREDINFRVIDIVREAGTSFAIPAQRAYLGRDEDAEGVREQIADMLDGG